MRLSRILMLIGALALPAVPAAAQGKAIGKPAGVGKPTTTGVKGGASGTVTKGKSADAKAGTLVKGKSADAKGGTLTKGNSADHAKGPKTTPTDTDVDADVDATATDSKGRGQLPLGEKLALNSTLKARLDALLVGSTLTYDQATTGWRNQGQLVAAMNAAERNTGVSFVDLHTKMTGPGQPSIGQAMKELQPETTTTTTTTTTVTTP